MQFLPGPESKSENQPLRCIGCSTWVRSKLYQRTGGYCPHCFRDKQLPLVLGCLVTFKDGTSISFWLTEEEFASNALLADRILQEIESLAGDVSSEDVIEVRFGEDWQKDYSTYEDFEN